MPASFQGAFTALVTPFRNGVIDEKALRGLVEFQIAAGIDGIVPAGTTGESVTLDREEYVRLLQIVVEQTKHRVPVVAGAGTNATHKTIELAKIARDAGADGLLLVCPYYNRPTQAGLEAHFRAIAAAVPLPTILYNVPSRTGCDLQAETVERLCDVSAIVAIKEATGNVLRAQEIMRRVGTRLAILSGDDAVTLGMLAVGAVGVISVTSNVVPDRIAAMCRAFLTGDLVRARDAHLKLLELHDALFVETNPGPVKAALHLKQMIAPEIRLPLVWPTEGTVARVRSALEQIGAL